MLSRDQAFVLSQGKLILSNYDSLPLANSNAQYRITELLDKSFSVYILNPEGKTLLINEFGAQICGYDSPSQSVGKSLFDVSNGKSAKRLLQNSSQVIKTQTLQIFDEINTRKDRVSLQFLSIKLPWYTKQKDLVVAGSLGFSIVLGKNNLSDSLFTLTSLGLLAPPSTLCSLPSSLAYAGISLTQREKECLDLSIKHFTAKQIAKKLAISHRTVEEHLANLKQKFGVLSKKELLQKIQTFC